MQKWLNDVRSHLEWILSGPSHIVLDVGGPDLHMRRGRGGVPLCHIETPVLAHSPGGTTFSAAIAKLLSHLLVLQTDAARRLRVGQHGVCPAGQR